MLRLLMRIPDQTRRAIAPVVGLLTIGVACFTLAGFADFAEKTKTTGHLAWKHTVTRSFGDRFPSLVGGIVGVGITLLLVAVLLALVTGQGRLAKYPPILTGVETIKIHKIASITGSSPSRVYQDIQTLIDAGIVDDFYIDYGAEQVVSKKYVPKSSHKTVVTCHSCGANNELIVGITKACSSCGEPLVLNTL